MYRTINNHPKVLDIYKQQLMESGILNETEINDVQKTVTNNIENAHKKAQSQTKGSPDEWVFSKWRDSVTRMFKAPGNPTGLPLGVLTDVARCLSEPPEDPNFDLHPEVEKLMDKRGEMAIGARDIDMPFAELLAAGTLLIDFDPKDENYSTYVGDQLRGYERHNMLHVRHSGQDVERGTFNQRHAKLFNQETGRSYIPLNNIARLTRRGLTLNLTLTPTLIGGSHIEVSKQGTISVTQTSQRQPHSVSSTVIRFIMKTH